MHARALDRDEELAGKGCAHLEPGRLARGVFGLVGLEFDARRVLHGPGRIAEAAGVEFQLARRAALGVGEDQAVAAEGRRGEGRRALAALGGDGARFHGLGVAHGLVGERAVGVFAQHRLPGVAVERGRQFRRVHGLAVRRDDHVVEAHGLAGCGRVARQALEAGVGGVDVDRDAGKPGDAPAAALAHARRDDGLERRRRRQVVGDRGVEGGLAVGAECAGLLEKFRVLEAALRVAEDVAGVALGRECRLDQPHPGLHGQVRARRAEEVAPVDGEGQRFPGAGGFRVRLDRDAYAVRHEFLHLEAVLADDRVRGRDLQGVGAGQGLGRQGLAQRDEALRAGDHGLFADLAALRVVEPKRHGHGRRYAQARVAHHGHAFKRFAWAVDVALAVDERRVADVGHDCAGDVEARRIHAEALVEQVAHVRALLHDDEVGPLVGQELGRHLGPEKPLVVGGAGGEFLVLVGQHAHARPGHGSERGIGGRPHEQVALALLGHDADVRDQDVALRALELAGHGERHAVEAGLVPLDVFLQVHGCDHGGVVLVAQRDAFAHDAVAEALVDRAAFVVVVEGGIGHGEKREQVVEIDAVDGQLGGVGVDAFYRQVLVAVFAEKHALVLEVHRGLEVRDAHRARGRVVEDRAVAGREALFQGHGVFAAGFERAA